MNHKWRKGDLPQLCLKCGILRNRKTLKLLMASVGDRDVFKYETKMVYTSITSTTVKRPDCKKTSKQ